MARKWDGGDRKKERVKRKWRRDEEKVKRKDQMKKKVKIKKKRRENENNLKTRLEKMWREKSRLEDELKGKWSKDEEKKHLR